MGPVSTAQRQDASGVPGSGTKLRTVKASPAPVPRRVQELAAADQRQAGQHDDLIVSYMPMAARIARSFARRGQDPEDLNQVAMLELVGAASRFDPSRGVAFAHYAYPCIVGAVKRHFRDNSWNMHVTRRMQELQLQTRRATPELTQLLGRTPTVPDMAKHLDLSEKEVRDGLQTGLAYKAWSLDQPTTGAGEGELGQLLGHLDRRLEAVPDRHVMSQYLTRLSNRERSILQLRFVEDLTQREIAEEVGISQMHVSRLLSRALEHLREMVLDQRR
jgi:RNA polymerase sigma-B factor